MYTIQRHFKVLKILARKDLIKNYIHHLQNAYQLLRPNAKTFWTCSNQYNLKCRTQRFKLKIAEQTFIV